MPCRERFAVQDLSYQDEVLQPGVRARVSVEDAVGQGWRDVVGDGGRIVSLKHVGASTHHWRPFDEFGITATAVAAAAHDCLRDAVTMVRPGGARQTSAPTTGGTGDRPA